MATKGTGQYKGKKENTSLEKNKNRESRKKEKLTIFPMFPLVLFLPFFSVRAVQ